MFWFILLGLGALVGAASIGWAILDELEHKKLAVLGERVVGKTALIQFLTTGTLPDKYLSTDGVYKTSRGHIKLEDLELKIDESRDLPGGIPWYVDWKNLTEEADIVLYLLRVDKLMASDKHTEERVKRDMGHIGNWLKENPKEFPLLIIGTHCDLSDPDLTKLPEDKIGAYIDHVRTMRIFQDIALLGGGENKVRFVFGSLKTKDTTEKLVYNMLASLDASQP